MPTDVDKRMREVRERRDEIRAGHEKVDEPEVVQTEEEKERARLRVNAAIMRDMSGETFTDSYVNHSATRLRRRAVGAKALNNGNSGVRIPDSQWHGGTTHA